MTDKQREEKIKALCDKEFLDKLAEVAKLQGWSHDYVEVATFVENLYDEVGLPVPELGDPYEIED